MPSPLAPRDARPTENGNPLSSGMPFITGLAPVTPSRAAASSSASVALPFPSKVVGTRRGGNRESERSLRRGGNTMGAPSQANQ